jgi:predicted nucleic acid-binding protein
VSLYCDTSSLLKTLFLEPESARVAAIIAAEPRVVVSTLTRLEARVRIAARLTGGAVSKSTATKLVRRMEADLAAPPFEIVSLPPAVAEAAEEQVVFAKAAVHCRSLDRLHLAVMHLLGLNRILTSDLAQARAARSLGFVVVAPG